MFMSKESVEQLRETEFFSEKLGFFALLLNMSKT